MLHVKMHSHTKNYIYTEGIPELCLDLQKMGENDLSAQYLAKNGEN